MEKPAPHCEVKPDIVMPVYIPPQPIPKTPVPERDPTRVIDQKSYVKLVNEHPEMFEENTKDDLELQKVILAEVEILREMWVKKNSVQQKNFEKVGVMVFSRTGRFITPLHVSNMYNKSKVSLRDRLRRSILKHRHNERQTEKFMCEWDFYSHILFFRSTLVEWEKDLRKKVIEEVVLGDDEMGPEEREERAQAQAAPAQAPVNPVREAENPALLKQRNPVVQQQHSENNRDPFQRPVLKKVKQETPDEFVEVVYTRKRKSRDYDDANTLEAGSSVQENYFPQPDYIMNLQPQSPLQYSSGNSTMTAPATPAYPSPDVHREQKPLGRLEDSGYSSVSQLSMENLNLNQSSTYESSTCGSSNQSFQQNLFPTSPSTSEDCYALLKAIYKQMKTPKPHLPDMGYFTELMCNVTESLSQERTRVLMRMISRMVLDYVEDPKASSPLSSTMELNRPSTSTQT